MPSSTSVRIAFLLGSGVSRSAGMPSVQKLTKRVLSGKDVVHGNDGNYRFGENGLARIGFPDEYVPRIVAFLQRLKHETDQYYNSTVTARPSNYEDLYYLAIQIHDSELREVDNPAVQTFIERILPGIEQLLTGTTNELKKKWKLHELAGETTHYIQDIVWQMLSEKPDDVDYLNCIKDACEDNNSLSVNIFTTNHDTVLEQLLSENKIPFTDGFGEPDHDVRYWDPELFNSESSKVRLFKLHGSVNWFRFLVDGGGWGDESICIPLHLEFGRRAKNPQGRQIWAVDGRPLLLVGTVNKMLAYIDSEIYASFYYQFYRFLRQTEALIISGYGFGDKGINTRIIEWIYSSPGHKITLVHPKPQELRRAARGAISNKWDAWISQKKLTIIPKLIEETSWQDIRESLFKTEEAIV